jgi:hypothetical protein
MWGKVMAEAAARFDEDDVPESQALLEEQVIHKVPNPFPLTIAGMMAMLGPQAINFGISVGGGEAYLLPNISARGALNMHWLMIVSVVLETALVYECMKYSMYTGRSFFAATHDLKPYGFWPWFWAIGATIQYVWPSWLGGAVIAAWKFTGISTQTIFPGIPETTLPPQYLWAVIALLMVLVVFYFSDRTYTFLARFFTFVMFANIILVLLITGIAARPEHYWQALLGYLGITFLMEGYPAGLPPTDTLALYGQPGGSVMFVSFWVVAAGYGMGRFAGQVTGPLRPPERITGQELRWDINDPAERAKMQQWSKLGGYSLILWWTIIGGLIMTYLYTVCGLAYLNENFKATGQIPSGVDVPIQMATIAAGVLGPAVGWIMLLFIMVTLYDAQFPLYDTQMGRTWCDAIAVNNKQGNRPYRFYYFLVVTICVLAGLILVLQAQPFIIWLAGSVIGLTLRSIGAFQILKINNKRLHPEFRVSRTNTAILWFTFVSGFVAVLVWLQVGGLAEIRARWGM